MLEAIAEARKAAEIGEVPVGAVITRDGEIIARAHNMVESYASSSAHAEMLAMDTAEAVLGSKWLTGCSLYVTLEPCSMCAGAMVLARIEELFIGTMDPKNGACGSVLDVAHNEKLNHSVHVETGIEAQECADLLTGFFRDLRTNRK